MNKILLAIVLCLSASLVYAECVPKRTPTGRIARSTNEVIKFRKLNPCPVLPSKTRVCPGYVVDHIIPLCACGPDKVTNMQWQSISESRVKDKLEVKLCKGNK